MGGRDEYGDKLYFTERTVRSILEIKKRTVCEGRRSLRIGHARIP